METWYRVNEQPDTWSTRQSSLSHVHKHLVHPPIDLQTTELLSRNLSMLMWSVITQTCLSITSNIRVNRQVCRSRGTRHPRRTLIYLSAHASRSKISSVNEKHRPSGKTGQIQPGPDRTKPGQARPDQARVGQNLAKPSYPIAVPDIFILCIVGPREWNLLERKYSNWKNNTSKSNLLKFHHTGRQGLVGTGGSWYDVKLVPRPFWQIF